MGARNWIGFVLSFLLVQLLFSVRAESAAREAIDTQFIFGFTSGADVGELGDKEIEHQTIAKFGKRDGSYAAVADELRYETSPIENFRFEFGPILSFYDIIGVTGLDDRRQGSLDGLDRGIQIQTARSGTRAFRAHPRRRTAMESLRRNERRPG